MLIGISPLLSPELLLALYKMGHGDEIVLADAHFPATSVGRASTAGTEVIRADGLSVPALLAAIRPLFPLDDFVAQPVAMMAVVPGDTTDIAPTVAAYTAALGVDAAKVESVERFAFYERAKKAFAVVATGDTRKYGNIILKKGLVQQPPAAAAA